MPKRKFEEIDNRENITNNKSIEKLPDSISHNIFSFFGIQECINAHTVSRRFHHLSHTYYYTPSVGKVGQHDMPPISKAVLLGHTVIMYGTKYSGKYYVDDQPILSIWNSQTGEYKKIPLDPDANLTCMTQLTDNICVLGYTNRRSLGQLHIWNIETKKVKNLEAGDNIITSVSALSDTTIVTASRGKSDNLCVWDIKTGACIKKRTVSSMENQRVTSITKLSDNTIITNLGSVWNIQTDEYKELDIFYDEGINFENNTILTFKKYHSDESDSNQPTLYNTQTGECIKKLNFFPTSESSIRCMTKLSSNIVLFGSAEGKLLLWDIKKNQSITEWTAHTTDVSFVFKLSGNTVISGSPDRTMRLWSFPPKLGLKLPIDHKDDLPNLSNLTL